MDVDFCVDSGFNVLGPKENGKHSVLYKLDAAGTQDIVALAKTVGSCTKCSANERSLRNGFRAAVKGTVTKARDDTSGAPGEMSVSEVQFSNDGFDLCGTVEEGHGKSGVAVWNLAAFTIVIMFLLVQ